MMHSTSQNLWTLLDFTLSLVAQLSLGSKQEYYEDCIECCREKMPKEPAKCHLSAFVNICQQQMVFTCH